MSAGPSLVHVVDDDATTRQQTVSLLRGRSFSVEAWPSTADFLGYATGIAPGVILIDLCRTDIDRRAAQAHLTDAEIALPCFVLTASDDRDMAVEAMRGGAIDVLTKPAEPERLSAAVTIGLNRLTKAQRRAATMRRVQAVLDLLSPREREVLFGLTRGWSNKEIAREMGISARTVEIHRASVMEKLDAESLAQALRIAFIAEVCRMVNPAFHVA
ncbi:response regulator transcription factor [Sphingomonas sp. 1P08PE]|uniref:response regulator transcription factor n=1 Tax=Sphingomonas sp. 1P08PE TaxID=554122 RepID=UPI0039A2BA07